MASPAQNRVGRGAVSTDFLPLAQALAVVRPMSPVEPLITPKELGVLLKVSINSARKIMRENGGIYVGAQLRWTQAKYERFLRTGGKLIHDAAAAH